MRGAARGGLGLAFSLLAASSCTLSSGGTGFGVGPAVDALPPPGFGTLSQREISLTLRSDDLQLMVTPLAPSILVVTAPDTYRRLDALVEPYRGEAEEGTLFLVSFFSDRPDVRFVAEEVQFVSQGLRARPQRVVPVTPGWGSARVAQRETQTALYLLDRPVDLESDLVLHYGLEQNAGWNSILARIRAERARARARAGLPPPPGHSSRSYFEIFR
jgi:hypothetical protein